MTGTGGHVFPLSGEPLATHQNDERGGEPVRIGSSQDLGSEALQTSGACHSPDLEAAGRGREAVQKAEGSTPNEGCI